MQFVPNRADLGTLALRAGGTGRRYCRLVTNDMDPGLGFKELVQHLS